LPYGPIRYKWSLWGLPGRPWKWFDHAQFEPFPPVAEKESAPDWNYQFWPESPDLFGDGFNPFEIESVPDYVPIDRPEQWYPDLPSKARMEAPEPEPQELGQPNPIPNLESPPGKSIAQPEGPVYVPVPVYVQPAPPPPPTPSWHTRIRSPRDFFMDP
jgi:hypothetical protein